MLQHSQQRHCTCLPAVRVCFGLVSNSTQHSPLICSAFLTVLWGFTQLGSVLPSFSLPGSWTPFDTLLLPLAFFLGMLAL